MGQSWPRGTGSVDDSVGEGTCVCALQTREHDVESKEWGQRAQRHARCATQSTQPNAKPSDALAYTIAYSLCAPRPTDPVPRAHTQATWRRTRALRKERRASDACVSLLPSLPAPVSACSLSSQLPLSFLCVRGLPGVSASKRCLMSRPAVCYSRLHYRLLTMCPAPTDPVGQSWPRGTGSVGRGAQGQ